MSSKKKSVLIQFGIGFAILIAGFIMGIIGFTKFSTADPDEQGSLLILILIGVVVFFIGVGVVALSVSRSRSICMSCGTSLQGAEYSYIATREYDTYDSNKTPTKRKVDVKISVVCPKCGKTKVIVKSFTFHNYSSGITYNVQDLVDDYCNSKFGH